MKKYAVILAGGAGTRAGGDMPKQFQTLLGIPLLWWSVRAFHRADPETEIAVVLHPGFFDWWDIMCRDLPQEDRDIKVRLVCGGPDRPHSVLNGIMDLPDSTDALIAVHDGARPAVSVDLIRRGWRCAEENGVAFPACPVTDSLRERIEEPTPVTRPVDRSRFISVQTPQVFRADILKRAFAEAEDISLFTDDASLVQSVVGTPVPFDGDPANIKVTNPLDFRIAAAILS